MRYRKQSADGDYVFGNGQLDFYRDTPEAVAQAVKTRLLLWLGEWFLDTTDGTPFMQGIIGKKSKEVADITVQDRVLSTEGVTAIKDFVSEINPDTRAYSANFKIDTIYGPTEVDLANYLNY